jgi:tRNA-2-methylthio-N6-dimethylallyladenosine synthase
MHERFYYIWTIGCQMNKAESERISSGLEYLGWVRTSKADEADLIILNSCVVRQSAENRVINKLNNLKGFKKRNPSLKIALTGCLVGSEPDLVKKTFPFIDYLFSPGDIPVFLNDVSSANLLPHKPDVASYVSIIQGCNNFCSYCIVPFRRGREKSRSIPEINQEVEILVGRGAKEITLLGQNVDSYGHDLPGKPDLSDLLQNMNSIKGLERIRFLTNHPKDMKSKLIDAIARLPKVCEQINVPVQAGDNEILKRMKRGYSVEQYVDLIEEIRAKNPEIALSSDIIVGFPGETEEQFENTYNLLARLCFDMVHVAAYSVRKGTYAARYLKDDVPLEIKKQRLKKIECLQEGIASKINMQLENTVVEVLVEGRAKGKWYGRTRTDKLVFFEGGEDCQSRLVNVLIKRTSPWSLTGDKV